MTIHRASVFLLSTLVATAASCGKKDKASDNAAPTPIAAEGKTGGDGKEGEAVKSEATGKGDMAKPSADRPAAPPLVAKASPADGVARGAMGAGGAKGVATAARVAPSKTAGKRMPAGSEMKIAIPDEEPPEPIRPQSGQLTAGEWSDLDNWGFWRGLFTGQNSRAAEWERYAKAWGFDTAHRIPVRVAANGKPVIDASVRLVSRSGKTLWTARTDNRGNAELFAGLFGKAKTQGLTVETTVAGTKITEQVSKIGDRVEIRAASAPAPTAALDLMFVVDTTGSMGDELSYLQAELRNVLHNVKDNGNQQLAVRTSVNFYRDTTDDYTVRPFSFTADTAKSLKQLAAQRASGGGDFPEAVDAAVADAIENHEWSQSARARLMFLILDAPPHKAKANLAKLQRSVKAAAAAGVRIIPIASSGIDKSTEFLLRSMAASTGGSYLFLTDHSGIGNSHLKPTIGPHEVKLLNRLLVEVIRRHLD